MIVCEEDPVERLKSCITKLTFVLPLKVELLTVIVSGYVPAGVDVDVLTVNVEEPELLIVAGLKLAVAPAGNPLTLSVKAPLTPVCNGTDTV